MAMQRMRLSALLTIVAAAMVVTALGALTASYQFNNTATVKAVGVSVYWYSNGTSPVTTIDWGTIAPGESVTKIIYIRNNGTVPVTLSMTTSGWSPSTASSYITLTWNCTNYNLNAGFVVAAALTLNVSSTVSGITSFSFDIVITGTGQ
jgi:hypothetical protein